MSEWPGEAEFEAELFSINSPSSARINAVAKLALKHYKYYKFVVHCVEKFIRKTKREYRLYGLYVSKCNRFA